MKRLPSGGYRDNTWLGAIDEVRHDPFVPSLRVVTETGTQAAACGRLVSTLPPTFSASLNPSPVLPVGPGE